MEYLYAALLLHKLGKEINESNLYNVIVASGVQADESKIKSIVTSLKGINIDKELESASLVTAAPLQASHESGEEKKEEKPKEEKKAAVEGLSALFG
ncbi:MAG: 50S ribosomal protein L12 [Candidatus Pacearchaeota archaeon]